MSDDEMMYDEEDYAQEDDDIELEGDDDDEEKSEEQSAEVDLENTYYNAKGYLDEDVDEALELFEAVLDMEETKNKWGFKALKQMVKNLFKLERYDQMKQRYKELLDYMKGDTFSKNDCENAITTILSLVSNSNNSSLLEYVYDVTLDALKSQNNEKLWFSTKLRLANLCLDNKDFARLNKVINELKQWCGTDETKRGSQLLDIYVLEIQLYTEQKENKKLKVLYDKCVQISKGAVVLNPRITGIIRECGGKMHMREKQWNLAYDDFFEAFKSYDEAGNPRRIQCLKYLVIANMLMQSEINPFEANEAKPYKNHSEILAMTDLIAAYQHHDIKEVEKILRNNRKTIMDDKFIATYIDDLLKVIRTQVLLKIIRPYSRIRIPFIAKELNISPREVEDLCVDLILDKKITGHIDQVNELLELRGGADKVSGTTDRYYALERWTRKISDIHLSVLSKVA